jgi:hypothetical protein
MNWAMNTLLLISQVSALLAVAAFIWLIVRAFKKHFLWGIAVLVLSPISAMIFGIRHWRDQKQPFILYMGSFITSVGLGLLVFTAWGGWELVQTAYRVHQGIENHTLSEKDAYAFMHANLQFIEKANPGGEAEIKLEFFRKYLEQHKSGISQLEKQKLQAEIDELMEGEYLSIAQQDELRNLSSQLAALQPYNDPVPEKETPVAEQPVTAGSDTATPATPRPQRYRIEYLEIDAADAGNYVGKTFKVTRRNSEEQKCRLVGTSPGRLHFEQRGRGGTFSFKYRYRDIEKLKLLAKVTY